jgi:hypothetical protein
LGAFGGLDVLVDVLSVVRRAQPHHLRQPPQIVPLLPGGEGGIQGRPPDTTT